MLTETIEIAVIGLPLAVAFGKLFAALGLDINAQQIADLLFGWKINPGSTGGLALARARLQRQ